MNARMVQKLFNVSICFFVVLSGLLPLGVVPVLAQADRGLMQLQAPSPAGEYPSTWIDDFNGPSLDSSWSWLNEDGSHWSFPPGSGTLEIMTQKTGMIGQGNTEKNLLVQDMPGGSFSIITHLSFNPTQNFQAAGLLVYLDEDHFLMLHRAFCDFCIGQGIYFDYENNGGLVGSNFATTTSIDPASTYLKISRIDNAYTGYVSTDGVDWTVIGTHRVYFQPTKVGLHAADSNQGAAEIHADFDFFEVQAPTTDTLPVIPADPRISAVLNGNYIETYDFPYGDTVTLTVDDPSTDMDPDVPLSGTVGYASWDPDLNYQSFSLPSGFSLKTGFVITATDGDIHKSMTIMDFRVTGINPSTNTVSGYADKGAWVTVDVWDGSGASQRVQADANTGEWAADFSGITTFNQWTNGQAYTLDPDDDATNWRWHVLNPYLYANLTDNILNFVDVPLGSTASVSIDDPTTTENPDLTLGPVDVKPADWDPTIGLAHFEPSSALTLKPELVVTATDGNIQKIQTINTLSVTELSVGKNTVSGISDPGIDIFVYLWDGNGSQRHVQANDQGLWTADFNTGDQYGNTTPAQLTLGMSGEAQTLDKDNNQTGVYWHIRNPYLWANPGADWVQTRDWTLGTLITLTIERPGIPTFTTTAEVAPASWNPGDLLADFQLGGEFDLQPGDVVTVTDGVTSRTYTVADTQVTQIDVLADTIQGIATAGSPIEVHLNTPQGDIVRHTIADDGSWQVSFQPSSDPQDTGSAELQPGSFGWAAEQTLEGNWTWVDWHVRNPYITANPASNWIMGWDFLPGDSIHLTIDEPGNDIPIDYEDTEVIGPASWDANTVVAYFNLSGKFWLKPGDTVTLAGKDASRTYTVANTRITEVNILNDTISGVATPGSPIHICVNIPGSCVNRYKTADVDGKWKVDYRSPGTPPDDQGTVDLQLESGVSVDETDANGNKTWVDWSGPRPTFDIRMFQNIVQGEGWPTGSNVSLYIDDFPYGTQSPALPPWGDPNYLVVSFDLGSLTLHAGQKLRMTDGEIIKEMTVSNFTITGASVIADTVYGTADPGSTVYLPWLCGQAGCASRLTQADRNGNWILDFSKSGTGNTPAEQSLYDIKVGDWLEPHLLDDDGDGMDAGWSIPFPTTGYVTGDGWIASPAGAYLAKPTYNGKATLSFTASYTKKPGAAPAAKVTFSFKDLNFVGAGFDWLAIEGARLQLVGTGTLNGKGSYRFIITATDGDQPGGGGADLFRIRIWDKNNNNAIVYDSMPGSPADAAIPTGIVHGGTITIHKEKYSIQNDATSGGGNPIYLPVVIAR